ncbi:Chaperone protein ClpB [compost metagenome]
MIVFNSLTREDIFKIIDISLGKLLARIRNLGYTLELTEGAKSFLSEKGYDQQYGARPLNRAIQKYVEDPLAEEILKGSLSEGDTILVDHVENEENLKFSKKSKIEEVEQ